MLAAQCCASIYTATQGAVCYLTLTMVCACCNSLMQLVWKVFQSSASCSIICPRNVYNWTTNIAILECPIQVLDVATHTSQGGWCNDNAGPFIPVAGHDAYGLHSLAKSHLISHQQPPSTLQCKLDALSLETHQPFLQLGRHLAVALTVVLSCISNLHIKLA